MIPYLIINFVAISSLCKESHGFRMENNPFKEERMKMMKFITRNRRTDLIDNNDNKDKEFKDKNNFKKGMLRYGLKSQRNLSRNLPINLSPSHLGIKTEA